MQAWQNVTGVILSAGRSLRMTPVDVPKGLLRINGKYVLGHIVDYWAQYCGRFITVVSPEARPLFELACSGIPWPMEFIEQPRPWGIADALSRVEGKVGNRFIVILGDCLCWGEFAWPRFNMANGLGIWETNNREDIERSYTVVFGSSGITGVIEKPKGDQVTSWICGMGFYFFSSAVFDYIHHTPPSPLRGEVEIIDVIDNMIKHGEPFVAVPFKGNYINLTYERDLERAKEMAKKGW